MDALGIKPLGGTPEEFANRIRADMNKWGGCCARLESTRRRGASTRLKRDLLLTQLEGRARELTEREISKSRSGEH